MALGYCSGDPLVSWLSRPGPGEKPGGALLSPSPVAPFSLAVALAFAADAPSVPPRGASRPKHQAEAVIALSAPSTGLPLVWRWGLSCRAGQLAAQGQGEEGIAQIREGLAAWRATEAELCGPLFLAVLAEAYAKAARRKKG